MIKQKRWEKHRDNLSNRIISYTLKNTVNQSSDGKAKKKDLYHFREACLAANKYFLLFPFKVNEYKQQIFNPYLNPVLYYT